MERAMNQTALVDRHQSFFWLAEIKILIQFMELNHIAANEETVRIIMEMGQLRASGLGCGVKG